MVNKYVCLFDKFVAFSHLYPFQLGHNKHKLKKYKIKKAFLFMQVKTMNYCDIGDISTSSSGMIPGLILVHQLKRGKEAFSLCYSSVCSQQKKWP